MTNQLQKLLLDLCQEVVSLRQAVAAAVVPADLDASPAMSRSTDLGLAMHPFLQQAKSATESERVEEGLRMIEGGVLVAVNAVMEAFGVLERGGATAQNDWSGRRAEATRLLDKAERRLRDAVAVHDELIALPAATVRPALEHITTMREHVKRAHDELGTSAGLVRCDDEFAAALNTAERMRPLLAAATALARPTPFDAVMAQVAERVESAEELLQQVRAVLAEAVEQERAGTPGPPGDGAEWVEMDSFADHRWQAEREQAAQVLSAAYGDLQFAYQRCAAVLFETL
ncbi:hypothetical protein UK23_38310 [Lentzea aerocolonigenes]|uniref:Uncharacterized protein n=1 Tax=Lentzea aerocolonigenes TaxID=68170 RepID=A0A0F0GJU4_LENAE|nr:hypothetical protein [Lentzea aerocolonigenes]KJK42192.1 hypothetical protein UK23_38310 [Lentzea aerocolonigenes]